MKDLIEKIGSKVCPDNGVIGFLIEIGYCIGLFLLTKFLPNIMSGGDPVLRSQLSGMAGFQIMIFITGVILPIYFLKGGGISIGGSGAAGKYGDQGSAKKGTSSSLRGLTGNDGIVLSLKNRLAAAPSCEHIAVIGPTGAGKSSCFYIPNLLEFDGKWSAVVTDPKGEMYDLCGPYLRMKGYETVKLAPLEADCKYNYNPILLADTPDELDSLAQLILTNGGKSVEQATGSSSGGAEWIAMAQPLLAAAFIWVRYCGKERTIYEAVKFILDTDKLDVMEKEFKKNDGAYDKFLLFKSSGGSERTMSSIKTTLASNVQLFTRESSKRFTATPFKMVDGKRVLDKSKLFNPKILRKKPAVVFICCPETQSIAQMPLMSVLYSQILEKCMENKEGNRIMFLLDEFANSATRSTVKTVEMTAKAVA